MKWASYLGQPLIIKIVSLKYNPFWIDIIENIYEICITFSIQIKHPSRVNTNQWLSLALHQNYVEVPISHLYISSYYQPAMKELYPDI